MTTADLHKSRRQAPFFQIPMAALVEVDGIKLGYQLPKGRVEVFRDLSLRATSGEYVVLVGPSGCGKTTLLRLLAGTFASRGVSAWTEGNCRVVRTQTDGSARISLLPQSNALLPWRSALRNVLLPLELCGIAVQNTHREHARALLGQLSISEFASYYPSQLSGGIAQRVALARALLPESDLLLLDEPLNSVDVAEKERIQPTLRSLIKASGTTVIHVTHDLYEATFMADRVLVLSEKPSRVTYDLALPHAERDGAFRESNEYMAAVKELRRRLFADACN
ncbi:MAG: ABC transporter ATP-binding protein [Burkholderiales bacterium]|nr:ABC transporter ATP-binding protein [Burkholderiales bacterium]